MATWSRVPYENEIIPIDVIEADGDLIVGTAAGAVDVITVGNEGDVLTVVSGVPDWAAPGAPGAHAASHKNGGGDEILLNEFGEPTGAVAFNGQQATDFVVQNVADAAALAALTGVIGKVAFQLDTGSLLAKEKSDLEQLQRAMADRQQRLTALQEEMARIHNTINYTAGKVAALEELLGGGGEES